MKIKTSYALIALAAISQGVMWVNVFKMLHDDIWAYIGGIPAGLAIVGLTSRSATILPRVTSKRARNTGWALLALLVAVEPVVLGFANYYAMYPKSIVVAGGASLVVTVTLIMGSVVDRSLVPVEKPARAKKKPAPKLIQPAVEPEQPAYICACGKEFGSQPALNAHQRSHKKVTGYKVSFEPVTNEKK